MTIVRTWILSQQALATSAGQPSSSNLAKLFQAKNSQLRSKQRTSFTNSSFRALSIQSKTYSYLNLPPKTTMEIFCPIPASVLHTLKNLAITCRAAMWHVACSASVNGHTSRLKILEPTWGPADLATKLRLVLSTRRCFRQLCERLMTLTMST